MEEIRRAAAALAADEFAHSSTAGGIAPDPNSSNALFIDPTFLSCLRKRHAFLGEYSEAVLAGTPLEVLLKLESTSIKLKNLEKSKDSEDKLASNREALTTASVRIEGGVDNRWNKLHESRFLPGAACTSAKLWLRGREVIRKSEHSALSVYDMASIGLAGHVTPKGWLCLSDPGDSSISINLFSIVNCGKKTTSKLVSEDLYEEVEELGELKIALRVLREALSFVHPWNKSVSVLEGFLLQCNWCNAETEGLDKRATIMTQFVDYILRENSNRWRSQEPFMSLSELKGAWDSFFGSRPQSALTKPKKTFPKDGFRKTDSKPRPSWMVPADYFSDDICVMYNLGKCVKAPGVCKTGKGVSLRHICNFRPDPSKPAVFCGGSHISKLYH